MRKGGGLESFLWPLFVLLAPLLARAEVLNPPYFNLAEGRKIVASATCGEGVPEPELYCKLVGAKVCDYCDPNDPRRAHPAEYAIDGTEKFWISPPLSRGSKYNEVNLTIDLGQEFHVAYVFIKMGNSPRPGVWILEKSLDNGNTYSPLEYFADTPSDCVENFGVDTLQPITKDDSVICETKFSKVVPLEGGEIVVSLLNDRPNADNFSYSSVLQEFTKATNIRLRFIRTKTLLGHLMSVARQDPTVTRRYFYSIKDINIGGRCVCNGHAETCDLTDPREPYKLLCRCKHNTCGAKCEECCPGYKQKKWRRAIIDAPFVCEPCNCFGHSDECMYSEEVDIMRQSLDIHGHYEGGGVCQNCWHNTQGINCNECKPTFYRPFGKLLNATDVCQPCNCDLNFSTGNCADGTGQCQCRPEFLPPYCDDCNLGYYDYPACKLCDCHPNGTYGIVCEVGGGQCPCKTNYGGQNCDQCQEGYYGFPDCLPCNCNPTTSVRSSCDEEDGQCFCKGNYGGRQCDHCRVGYYNYPICEYCSCDPNGCIEEICDNQSGECLCKFGYGGPRCDTCAPEFFGYPKCEQCNCDQHGSISSNCDYTGRCQCLSKFGGLKCEACSPGYYDFPNCHACDCDPTGSIGLSCNSEGQCVCKNNFDGQKCDFCKEEFYNYPYCEECNCNPAGVLPTFLGCGSVPIGQLCECKERVTGRICNECKPLYWNLKVGNPMGCEDCNCFSGGTVGGITVCLKTNGQCMCKPNVASRECAQCKDGTYELDSDDLFGCKDCGCDIGGSVNNVCDKDSGQCACRPRISGRKCNRPLETHYFPTLFQLQYEIEDGRTPTGTEVRYGHDSSLFPGFSWRGYAIFRDIQKEVLMDLYVEKPSLYQVYFHYLNFGGENIYGTITFTSESFADIQQSSDMVFEATSKPKLMKVSGKEGILASPFVLNPGRWSVSIRIEKPLFLDYMVLLPQSYYEGTLLQEDVGTPCNIHGEDHELCRYFRYPLLPVESEIIRGEAGYKLDLNGQKPTNLYDDLLVLDILKTERMAWLNESQHNLYLDSMITRPGTYVMIITYHTPVDTQGATASIEISTHDTTYKGSTNFYECSYSFLCRQVIIDQYGQVLTFDLNSNHTSTIIYLNEEANIGIDNVALVPATLWSMDYIVPETTCVKRGGSCIQSEYTVVPESIKVDFESDEYPKTNVLPENILDPDIGLVNLNEYDNVVDAYGSVPSPALYVFVVHYYQPSEPSFEASVLIRNGEFHEGVLPVGYCPSVTGCRAIVHNRDFVSKTFHIKENFYVTIKQPTNKTMWVDYLLAIPINQFHENVLQPLREDKAGKFITECGENSFLLSPDVKGFCRDAAFSLTSEYNNGALPCQCNTDGSLSYECDEFGGQCQCRSNVIGRTCSRCKTGYFGFPNCKPCDCPSTAICQPVSGQCICPPRVTGERCDTCVPYTFGFDPIIGCENCNCNPLGVLDGDLWCNVESGECRCKPNIVSRTCDKCKAGYWAFPYCQLCNCDLRGTKDEICNPNSAKCACKENVHGDSCDQCKPGTFYLEEVNPLGCTKCFCFGTTDRCSSGYIFRIQLTDMSNWKKRVLNSKDELAELNIDVALTHYSEEIQGILPDIWPDGALFYFSVPDIYLGNQLSSYGGNLNYNLYTVIDKEAEIQNVVGPDLILMGNNITIVHSHVEQPVSGFPFKVNVNLIEHEFHLPSGREVSREQMMMVLVKLESILVRGSYFYPIEDMRLSQFSMVVGVDYPIQNTEEAHRVEQCHCPPNYRGNSCEECAAGYYRSKTGPYLGYCIPCECHGHADSCDVNTGICIGCQHNTVGDHCEKCAPGYHGDSTVGNPYDCLICACPIPFESNNFALACEVSPSGDEISCDCKPGYYGNKCEVCDIGYFGNPETLGSSCEPCQCSGNIDASLRGSCDSVTGECIMCLNNTFGSACELCAPGFYGDAISKKDCKKCDCIECGTIDCNHGTGECECFPNVEYPYCDKCVENHWGFNQCRGCRPCNCGPASKSQSCDLETGQCECQPGANGLTCDSCEPGFWKYSSQGCISCDCDATYSAGAVCNPVTGHCECLPGVLGDKCGSCPHRWVFVKNEGCLTCDPCVHSLLDTTGELENLIDPVMEEMQDVSLSYFANKRLQNVNKTADALKLGVDELASDPSDANFNPLEYDIIALEKFKDKLDRNSNLLYNQAETIVTDGGNTRIEAIEVEALIHEAIGKMRDIVDELGRLSEGLQGSLDSNVDKLVEEAGDILSDLQSRNFETPRNNSKDEKEQAKALIGNIKDFEFPVFNAKMKYEEGESRVLNSINLLKDLTNNSHKALEASNQAEDLEDEIQRIPVKAMIAQIEQNVDGGNEILQNASDLLEKTKMFIDNAENAYQQLEDDVDRLQLEILNLKDHIGETTEELTEIQPTTEDAEKHANFLKGQADLLDRSLADTRDSADLAVKAANAYGDIEGAINAAYEAAEAALNASQQAAEKSDGVLDKTDASKDKTNELHDSAYLLEKQVEELEPQLEIAKDNVSLVAYQNGKNVRALDIINKDLEKLPLYSLGVLAGHAANSSALANDVASRARDKMENVIEKLPEDIVKVTQLPKDIDDTRQAIKAAHTYADRVASIVPDTNNLMDRASKKESAMRIIGTDVSEKLRKLEKQVAVARNAAKRIKLGVQFFDNTTLQLRNPDNIEKSATYTHLSMFFKTAERYGLLAFIGNEKGTHNQMKRVLTDDYLGLEIRGGRIVLVMDLGSGFQDIKHDSYVSDGRWHHVIVERTGKTCTITVRTEDEPDSVIEGFLPGTYSVFNLNQKLSKFFIGGIGDDVQLPDTIKNFHFDGCIEEVEFGETPIGLWDFVKAKNNFEGCAERDQLEVEVPSNGLKFSGAGYVILPKKKHQFGYSTHIKIPFKTYNKEGLLFLIGKNTKFFAIELKDGHVVLKYNLGSGTVVLTSPNKYNDGKWHSLEATRGEDEGILIVDQVEVASARSPGNEKTLSTTNQIFVGGHPSKHSYQEVTSVGFEGCIRDMYIFAELIDLNKNKEALGVVNGCPVSIARIVSFNNVTGGYVAMPPADLEKFAELTFKFKTAEEDAVIFYSANDDQSNYLLIALHNGILVMSSKPGNEIRTNPDVKYNDQEWHYVSATKALRQMRLDIDDINSVEIELSVNAIVSTTTPMYFGGVPEGYTIEADVLPSYKPFSGCLGDTTVNNKFQNFADTQLKKGVSLANCPLADPYDETILLPTLDVDQDIIDEVFSTIPTTTEEEGISIDYPDEPEPTPVAQCALPIPPRKDTSVQPGDGIRFGNAPHSRQEFTKPGSFINSIVDDSTFALEFKTTLMGKGVMFYVADRNHKDFVGLTMKNGKILYLFNCGTGSAVISTQKTYNDGTWHRVVFSRTGRDGRLVLDDDEEVRGSSLGSASSVNVKPPFYVGGLADTASREAKSNLRGVSLSFPGCIRNVEAQGELLTAKKPVLSQNITGCSDMVEEGAYFSSEGGYLVLYDKWTVGRTRNIILDIKPRNVSGILLAVHGRHDYLIVQLVDGQIIVNVNNGDGNVQASYLPEEGTYSLCDGRWHSVQLIKQLNTIIVGVDGAFSAMASGQGGVSSADTKDPLYIGGMPQSAFKKKKGIETTEQFVGCMRYLMIDNESLSFAQSRVFGEVTLNTCPTI